MEEQWVAYLRENNPELYEQAVESIKWAAEWRDKQLAAAKVELDSMSERLVEEKFLHRQTEQKLWMKSPREIELEIKLEQAEAQCVAMQTAINRYVFGNIELLDALKAALEENP